MCNTSLLPETIDCGGCKADLPPEVRIDVDGHRFIDRRQAI